MSGRSGGIVRAWADAWMRLLFWHTTHALWVPRVFKPVVLWLAWHTSRALREPPLANARWLLGVESGEAERRRLAQRVIANFYDAIVEFGSNRRRGAEEILSQLEAVEGEAAYDRARALRRGAILVTAHLGTFETALAMLAKKEPSIYVVFRRDRFPVLERLRSEQHARWGIHEAPSDDGLATWIRVRDALAADSVVLLQGDRASPGEKGLDVPFFAGHLRMPTGAARLASCTGAPIVPTFAVRSADNRVRIFLEEPIWPDPTSTARGSTDAMVLRIAASIEHYVKRYPDQWLMPHKAWVEDQVRAGQPPT